MRLHNIKIWQASMLLGVLLQCAGCKHNKVSEWGKNHFTQADHKRKDVKDLQKQYFRTQKTYDQFSTVADFSALLLSDDIRKAYVDYYGYAHFKSEQEQDAMLKRLQKENEYYLSFYVMSYQRQVTYENAKALFTGGYQKRHAQMLGALESDWKVTLRIAGVEYEPDAIKKIELPIEYEPFFKGIHTQFKQVYLIRFDAQFESLGIDLFASTDLELVFRSIDKETILSWQDVVYQK
ncbi:hypothetical protein EBR77_01000 [bacterium]|nr:hypothetical protein [bacterium]